MHCPPRAVQDCCCCHAFSFPPHTALNEVTVRQGFSRLDISAKWPEGLEVCASPSAEGVHFYSVMKVSDE